MTQKELQAIENRKAEAIKAEMLSEIEQNGTDLWTWGYCPVTEQRLRSCSAWVYETANYYILRSYSTIIACIDKRTDTLCDFLRLVYGYTATSAQHISKFSKDYGYGKWGCANRITWKDI